MVLVRTDTIFYVKKIKRNVTRIDNPRATNRAFQKAVYMSKIFINQKTLRLNFSWHEDLLRRLTIIIDIAEKIKYFCTSNLY